MELDNVEAIKSLVAVGLGASIVPSLSVGAGRAAIKARYAIPAPTTAAIQRSDCPVTRSATQARPSSDPAHET